MFIPWYDRAVRLTGRWSNLDKAEQAPQMTQTTAPGSYFELAFTGTDVLLAFDMGYQVQPYPHLWLTLDDGDSFEASVDHFIRVQAKNDGKHVLRVLYKGGMEMLPRWHLPLIGVVSFLGAYADAPAELPEDHRKVIEFIGDSITEGVLIDENLRPDPRNDQMNRPYQDDHCATYAALTAQRLGLRSIVQAYGAVGMTHGGCGGVPRAGLLYPYAFENAPYHGISPDYIVINHGANDRGHTAEEYLGYYGEYLDMLRDTHPNAIIVCLSAFCGAFDRELGEFVERYNAEHHNSVHFVSSNGWVPLEPLHPARDGHRIIADHLTPILEEIFHG